MEANNIIANNTNTAERAHQHHKIKSINSLYFNALNNNQKNKMQQMILQPVPEEQRLLNINKKPVIIPMSNANGDGVVNRNGMKKICDKPKADNNHTQDSVAAKMLRMGGQELPGLVSSSCQSSNGPLGSKAQVRPVTLRLPLSEEDGAHARCAAVNPSAIMAGQQPQPAIRSSSFISSDIGSQMSNSKPYPDAVSIRSLASIGMGSTDGKRMVIRKVPTSPVELLNIANAPTPPDDYDYDADSYGNFSEDPESLYLKPRRQHWANKMQFVMACVGYSVGLGNIWRFPYLCYKSGGGVFLIPYFLIMVVCGIPMLYMELAVGQFTGRGPIGALGQICPLFKGAGLASVVISFLMSTYYSVIIAYGIYYFFTSFKPQMPWEKCNHRWNTQFCWESHNNYTYSYDIKPTLSRTPSEEFYNHKVLQISTGIEDPGSLRWDLVACLLCAWIMVYFAIWKSIKSSAKVRYITATLPFLLIVVFLLRSLSLDGADKGMRYFFRPKWELLADAKVWVNAAAQIFNSFGVAFGSMISFASYNRYNNNILHDTLAVSFVNAVTSLLVGIFAFAVIGNIATEQNTSIEAVISDGPGLIFVVYPQAIAKMPASQLWAVLFFFMLLCLGLNSQFAIVEVVVTSIQDGFPGWIKKKLVCHEMLVLIVCVVSFLFGLPNVTKGGIYFFQLMDHYAASISIMYLAFFEVIAIAWFYGVWRLSKNIENMNAKTPSLYFKFCWMIAAPLFIMALWIFCLIDYESPTYNNGEYRYPVWAIVLGWIISSLSIACIPLFAIYVFIKSEGETYREKLRNSLMPDLEECKICGDHNCEHMEEEQEMQEISPMLILKLDSTDAQSRAEIQTNNGAIITPKV